MRGVVGDRQHGRRLVIGVLAIVVLLIIDGILIALAMSEHDSPPASSARPSSTPPASAVPTDDASASPVSEPAASRRLLSAASGGSAWRAIVGSCDQPGVFEVTTDGGATWVEAGLDITGPVLALEPGADGRRGVAVMGGDQCAPVAYRTFTSAVGWEPHPTQQVGSYVTEDGQLVMDGMPTPAPCVAPSAATGAGGGAVLCGDEAWARTDVGGWVSVATGVAAIGPADEGIAVALTGADGCEALAVGIVASGELRTGCSSASPAGSVAVSAAGGETWIWADDTVEIVRR